MFNLTKEDIKKGFNATINMYVFFGVIEIGLSYIKQEDYSIYRVLLYSFAAHCVATVISFTQKKEQNSKK